MKDLDDLSMALRDLPSKLPSAMYSLTAQIILEKLNANAPFCGTTPRMIVTVIPTSALNAEMKVKRVGCEHMENTLDSEFQRAYAEFESEAHELDIGGLL